MITIIISLLMIVNLVIIYNTMLSSKDEYKDRCVELKAYIKFLESVNPIEDAEQGASWLNERADRRALCDIQDINR